MACDSEMQGRQHLVEAYRQVVGLGLTQLSSGNISLRYRDGMLISPTGASAETISVDNVVFIGADGTWDASARPSSEWQLHARVYQGNPATQAVVHTHSDNCVAVACHCRPLPGFHYMVGAFGSDHVPCVPYSTFGSEQLATDVAQALTGHSACLMGNHGMTARGGDMAGAIRLAHLLEICCRQYLLAQALGEPRHLTRDEWTAFHARAGNTGYGR